MARNSGYIPGPDLRLNQYRVNKISFSAVNGLTKRPNDWAVTITFYAALHLIEKYLTIKYGKHKRKHEDRKRLVVEEEVFGEEVADAYLALFNDCITARYHCIPITDKQVTDAVKYLNIIEDRLTNV
jgi:hypothetical protein